MPTRFVKSSVVLAVVALAWTAGIVLLHFCYVAPRFSEQVRRMEHEATGQWLHLANAFLRTRRNQMLRVTADWAGQAGVRRIVSSRDAGRPDGELAPESLARNGINTVLFCDAAGRVISSWAVASDAALAPDERFPPGQDLSELPLFRISPEAGECGGVLETPLGLAVFARCGVDDGAGRAGYIVSLRPINQRFMGELSAMAGVSVRLEAQPTLPDGSPVPTVGHAVWRCAMGQNLRGAQVFRDAEGRAVSYMVVEGRAENAARLRRSAERALVTTLLWAVTFALLMILVIHVVVSGPTARLLSRIRRLRSGEDVESLSSNLRGEAFALARQFEEVLAHVEKLSQTDALTGVANRRSFQRCFTQDFRRARRYSRPLALAVIDLDFFKAANDALGHQIGDSILKMMAEVIGENVRTSDLSCRLGGDEFAVLFPETTAQDAFTVAERIRVALAARAVGRGELRMNLTSSIGIVDISTAGADTPEAMFELADQAMYAAKRLGRNRTVLAEQTEALAGPAGARPDANKVDDLCKQLARLDAKFKRLFVDAITGLISALEARDEHTANHSSKVRHYSTLISRQMDLPERTVEHIARAAMLHDIGKIGLPDSVLLKDGNLTEREWDLVRRHPVMSVRIMEGMEFLDQEIPAVRYHHERYDGSGHPEGLSGSSIPLAARILAVADAFDAMTSSRIYRGGMPVEKALTELRRGSGTQFDPAAVDAFVKAVAIHGLADTALGAPALAAHA